MKRSLLLFGALSAIALTGCATMHRSSRLDEKSPAFASLDYSTQLDVRQGIVRAGFTPDMVAMALGQPAEKTTIETGHQDTWVYHIPCRYFYSYPPPGSLDVFRSPAGMPIFVFGDDIVTPSGDAAPAFHPRDYQPHQRLVLGLRIAFRDGRVAAVEWF
jgi:hypothetical protein